MGLNRDFWRGRRVFLTGHTGFKGAWLARWLHRLDAEVHGYALPPESEPSLCHLLATPLAGETLADLRDAAALRQALLAARPDIVLHLAAQALVPASFRDPGGTWASNVTGTVNLLEALRGIDWPAAALVVTTDKVYANDESGRAFPETAPLGGDDPYSASKAATEIAVHSWKKSFLGSLPLATARAGNVIGGGDWSAERLIPDIVRAAARGEAVQLRRPEATRPWQHVLDPLHGYLLYAQALFARRALPESLNFGPLDDRQITVGEIATQLARAFDAPAWQAGPRPEIAEKGLLNLDAGLAVRTLDWRPRFGTAQALDETVAWYRAVRDGENPAVVTDRQIAAFEDSVA